MIGYAIKNADGSWYHNLSPIWRPDKTYRAVFSYRDDALAVAKLYPGVRSYKLVKVHVRG